MSLLHTDGYKFSMAEAGWPLRQETFYYAQRRGGPAIVPFDAEAELRKLMPEPTEEDYAYLARHEYEMGAGFKAAILRGDGVAVRALPKGAWFLPREPVFSVSGPSAIVSWLEPLTLQLHYRIQIATLALNDPSALAHEVGTLTCEEQKSLVLATLDAVGVRAPKIVVDTDSYFETVKARVEGLVAIVQDPARIFEVGLRAATCISQHMIALEACKAAGLRRTSHVAAARKLDMVPVGTMGHEHIQRYGSDEAAFRAMRDRRPGRSSYLLDTFDTIRSGIPAAYRLMEEGHQSGDSIRYDSGDKESQYRFAAKEARRRGIRSVQILEDSFDAPLTAKFESLRREVGWAPEEQFYGYGGYLIAKTSGTSLIRDRVAAVYKLSQTATSPTMKFGDDVGAGKESVPGNPVVFRRRTGEGPQGVIGQAGERAPAGYVQLTGESVDAGGRGAPGTLDVALSEETMSIAAKLRAAREALMQRVGA